MKYIYADEAGTSAKEPVTVVAAIIVDADLHWRKAEQAVKRVLETHVPAHLLTEDFVFHAKEIWGSPKLRENWPLESRLSLLTQMMRLPVQLGLGVAFGMCRREAPVPTEVQKPSLRKEDFHHMIAFYGCLSQADKYIRHFGPAEHVATLIAEDVPNMRDQLRNTLARLRAQRLVLTPQMLNPSKRERSTGIVTQDGEYWVERVVDGVHFTAKPDAPLLQIADACAFGLRRYFAEQSHGQDFHRAITAIPFNREDWEGWTSSGCYGRAPV